MKRLFSETLSMKNQGQESFDNKVYQDTVLVSLTTTLPIINTATYTREHIYSLSSIKRIDFATQLHSSFCVTYWKFCDVGIKR